MYYDNTGAAVQQAIWLDDLPVGLIANGNQLHYIEPDHLGTPRVVVEVTRNVPVWTWDLKSEAFGNSMPNQDQDGDANALVFDIRFPGQRYDVSTGLSYNYFRDYDSATGRYVESDPIGLLGGLSTYLYVLGSPLRASDLFGLMGGGNPYPQIAIGILRDTYDEMKRKDVRGTDQFFHCLAGCRATKRTRTPAIVRDLMTQKEWGDYGLNIFGMYGEKRKTHQDMLADMAGDQAANELGITCPTTQDCNKRCSPLLDNLLPSRRPYMQEYRTKW